MATTITDCPCCLCCACGPYCFSKDSTVHAEWSVTPVDGADACLCNAAVLAGSGDLAWVSCGVWRLENYHTEACGETTNVYYAQASFNCGENKWSFVVANDHDPGGVGDVLFDGIPGDGCGATTTDASDGTQNCPFTGGSLTLTVNGNRCCNNGSGCVVGTPACDGTCNPLP